MNRRPKKSPRHKDLTSDYLGGHLDDDRLDTQQRFTERAKHLQQNKTLKTTATRAQDAELAGDVDLPVGEVVQIFSLFSEVQVGERIFRCTVRKTLNRVSETAIVVGDRVGILFTSQGTEDGSEPAEAVIEKVLPRKTLLTRSDSFKAIESRPIVANAEQMLIVASLRSPRVKWGLIDRMIVAAMAGGLSPAICLNKLDLALPDSAADEELQFARGALEHYRTLNVHTLETSVELNVGLEALQALIRGRTTVLAGHSGVGKSSLVRSVQPQLDLRVGEVSQYTEKGRHTTTSARRFPLDFGSGHDGYVIDTPGVKLFGLWGLSRENIERFFPDVVAGTAPSWRQESFERIAASLSE